MLPDPPEVYEPISASALDGKEGPATRPKAPGTGDVSELHYSMHRGVSPRNGKVKNLTV